MFEQMTTKRGIKKIGKRAIQSLTKEFTQFVDLNVFKGVDPNKLASQQKREALRAISLIKLKRSFMLKGRVVADGRPQRKLYDKEQRSSATCHHDSFIMSLLIDVMEK